MKTLEELGISPAPWRIPAYYLIESGDNKKVIDWFNAVYQPSDPDAVMMSAAPELYQSVVDLLEICGNIEEYIGVDPATCGKIAAARKAVAKAGGEE